MRKLLVLLAIVAMAALTGACGSPEDEGSSAKKTPEKAERPTAVETVQVAYRETAAEQTAKTFFEMTTTSPAAGPQNGGQAPMTFTMRGQGVMDFSGAASSVTTEMFGMGSFEVRQIENTVYMKMPKDFVAQMPGAKPWVEADLEDLYGQQSGSVPGQMEMGKPQDPTRQLEYLRGVSDSVEKVGTERVRGTQTTHYRAMIDLKKAAAEEGAEAQEAQDEVVEKLGTDKLPVEVWLDDQNRVRRFALDLNVPAPENAASPNASPEDATMRTQMVAEYYDFGTSVDVQAPPPDQIMDGSELLSGQQPVAQ